MNGSYKVKESNLIAGTSFPVRKEFLQFEAGTYSRGELIECDPTTKKLKKCTNLDNLVGVMVNDVTLEDGQKETIYVTGIFYIGEIVKDSSLTDDLAIQLAGLKRNIYFEK